MSGINTQREFMEAVNGFRVSRAILSAIELELFLHLGEGGTAEQVAARAGTDARATKLLLNALAAIDVLNKEGDVFTPGSVVRESFQDPARRGSGQRLMHTAHIYRRWMTLSDCVREGTSVPLKKEGKRNDRELEAFIQAMQDTGSQRATDLVEAVGAAGIERLLDAGGGPGAYSAAFCRANPAIRATVLDLPEVVPLTRRHVEQMGLTDRIDTVAGDVTEGIPFSEEFDLVLLSNILHIFNHETGVTILRGLCGALKPGGRIAVQDFFTNDDGTEPVDAALFALNMLVNTECGGVFSFTETKRMLVEAGFDGAEALELPGRGDLVIGWRS